MTASGGRDVKREAIRGPGPEPRGTKMDEVRFIDGRVIVKVGDITREHVDAVVNAANSSLMGGGGVDGAIHRAGGPEILAACKSIRGTQYPDGLPTGEAIITGGGRLPAPYVIHTVGPVYGRGGADKARQLASCYRRCLALAAEKGLGSIAFPAISTGVYGYPPKEAAAVSSAAIKEFLETHSEPGQVRLVFFSPADAEEFVTHHEFDA